MTTAYLEVGSKVFVAGQGLAKVKEMTRSRLTVWLSRAAMKVEVDASRVRPLLSKAEAEALLQVLRSPLPAPGPGPTAAEAARVAATSKDAAALAATARAIYAKSTLRDEALTEPMLMLQSFLAAELSTVLEIPPEELAFATEAAKPKRRRDANWLARLCKAGLEAKELECELRCVELPEGASPFRVWTKAHDALAPIGMYPVILAREILEDEFHRPDEELDALRKKLGSLEVAPNPKWPEVDLALTGPCVLAVMPFPEPWLVAPYLRFGGWNACPAAVQHAKAHLQWHESFCAWPVCLERSSLDAAVLRPPDTRPACDKVARQLLHYCDDLALMGRRKLERMIRSHCWSFWWD